MVKWFLRASVIYLVLGLAAQLVAVFDVWLGFNPLAYTTVTVTTQLLLTGWLTQAALALLYGRWPPIDSGPSPQPNRRAGWPVFVLFNTGLPLVIVGQPGLAMFGGVWPGAVAALGALLQLAAAIIFGRYIWRRSKKGQNNLD